MDGKTTPNANVEGILEGLITQRAKANWCDECKEWVAEPMMICHPGPEVEGEPLVKRSNIFYKNDPRLIAALRKAIGQRDVSSRIAGLQCSEDDDNSGLAAILRGEGVEK